MTEVVDGQYQKYMGMPGSYVRDHFFGKYPEARVSVELLDEKLLKMKRGGHDPEKVYAAYKAAVEHKGQPTVILPKQSKDMAWAKPVKARILLTIQEDERARVARVSIAIWNPHQRRRSV